MAKKIAIVCHKGGVGKTTTAASLGGIFSAQGERVLLVDTDPQTNLTRIFADGLGGRTIYEAFKEKRGLPVVNVRVGLDVVPSSVDMSGIDSELASAIGKERILAKLLREVEDRYDWILIDCPAQLGIATANALTASDVALIPVSCDKFSGEGLSQITEFINMVREEVNPDLKIVGVVVTRYRPRRIVDSRVVDMLSDGWKDLVCKTKIRENAAIVQAPLAGMDIWSYDPKSYGALDYEALLEELKGRISKIRRTRR